MNTEEELDSRSLPSHITPSTSCRLGKLVMCGKEMANGSATTADTQVFMGMLWLAMAISAVHPC